MSTVYKKVYKMKNGETKVYEYVKDSKPYSKKSYINTRGDKIKCDSCGRFIYACNIDEHKARKICGDTAILNKYKEISV